MQENFEVLMRILILDDSKQRHKVFAQNLIGNELVKHCYTYDEFCDTLMAYEKFDVIYFDHDLNFEEHKSVDKYGNELTGYHAALVLSELPEKYPDKVIIHSFNSVGAKNIEQALKIFDIRCVKVPFSVNIGLAR